MVTEGVRVLGEGDGHELLRLADLIDHLIEGGGDDAETHKARQAARAPLIEAFEEARPVLY